MARVYNFSAGPSMMPESVLKKAASELLEYPGTGQSVMEMSHRSKEYEQIIFSCEELLRSLLNIPENYDVLFIQGGASMQFSMIPFNLLTGSGKADYVISGQFSNKAYQEGARFGDCKAVASSKADNFTRIPALDSAAFAPDADYFHICYNNTIYGTRFHKLPDTGKVPLVADMSSYLLSEPVDIAKYGLIYAGAQKNIGPAGVTIVIVDKALVGRARPDCPAMYNYATYAGDQSMYNTPPTYAIYICKMVMEWIRDEIGGLKAMQERNIVKAAVLYDYLDRSAMFKPIAVQEDRSQMNVTFATGSPELDAAFIKDAAKNGLLNLKGHRSAGGMRASIYNAMPPEGIAALVRTMKAFEQENK